MKTTAKKQADLDIDNLSLAEAATITGYSEQWLRQLARDGFYPRRSDGRVALEAVIRGIERSITGWRPPGYEGGYRR